MKYNTGPFISKLYINAFIITNLFNRKSEDALWKSRKIRYVRKQYSGNNSSDTAFEIQLNRYAERKHFNESIFNWSEQNLIHSGSN